MTRYRCVDDQKAAGFPVTAACEAAGVSTSEFYHWRTREAAAPTEREVAESDLVEIYNASDGNYGVPRMHRELRRAGLCVNKKKVHRLMRLQPRYAMGTPTASKSPIPTRSAMPPKPLTSNRGDGHPRGCRPPVAWDHLEHVSASGMGPP